MMFLSRDDGLTVLGHYILLTLTSLIGSGFLQPLKALNGRVISPLRFQG